MLLLAIVLLAAMAASGQQGGDESDQRKRQLMPQESIRPEESCFLQKQQMNPQQSEDGSGATAQAGVQALAASESGGNCQSRSISKRVHSKTVGGCIQKSSGGIEMECWKFGLFDVQDFGFGLCVRRCVN